MRRRSLFFALFMGVALSVTAFPVMVRILTDRSLQATDLGTLAISCAAVADVVAWCLLAFVSSLSHARPDTAWLTTGLTTAFVVIVFAIVGPIVRRTLSRHERLGHPLRAGRD